MRKRINTQRALTLVELLVASGIMVILLMALMPLISASSRSWQRNSTDVDLTTDLALAMRRITNELRRAKAVTVDTSGTRIEYTLPNNARGVFGLSFQTLKWHPAEGSVHTIDLLQGVQNIDPLTGTTYPLFQLDANGRTVTVRLCVHRQTPVGARFVRMQELVVLRNR